MSGCVGYRRDLSTSLIIDQRHNKATIVTSQYDPAEWLDQIPTADVAEAITDRLASQAYRIIIRGNKSMRETIHK